MKSISKHKIYRKEQNPLKTHQNDFETLLSSVRVVVERYIHYRIQRTHDAEDVIQETYLGAYKSFDNLKEKSLFKPWILSIAKNQCNIWYRSHMRRDDISLDTLGDSLEADTPAYDECTQIVSDILRQMPEDAARLLLRYYMEGESQATLAKQMQVPVGTVKSRLFYAKKHFKEKCPPEILSVYERGSNMKKDEMILNFPKTMPELTIEKATDPFFEVKFEEDSFIIPRIGNRNTEGTYRYPDKNLALVSTCYVPKKAKIHSAEGVQVCRDTYNIKRGKLYKNECVWFAQLTDEYLRTLATLRYTVDQEDNDIPTEIHTFLEEDFDVLVNGDDKIHGMPLVIKENPTETDENGIHIPKIGLRYTMGTYSLTLGNKTFETIKFVLLQNGIFTEHFVDRNGRLVLMRWYQSQTDVNIYEWYTKEYKARIQNNPSITVNGEKFILIEDRISEYAI